MQKVSPLSTRDSICSFGGQPFRSALPACSSLQVSVTATPRCTYTYAGKQAPPGPFPQLLTPSCTGFNSALESRQHGSPWNFFPRDLMEACKSPQQSPVICFCRNLSAARVRKRSTALPASKGSPSGAELPTWRAGVTRCCS